MIAHQTDTGARLEEIRRQIHGLQMLMVVRPYDVAIVAEHRDLVRERNALLEKVVA